ncbi:MAG: hypothetical protein ACE15C_02680 [Phycisphaerae bacterium]
MPFGLALKTNWLTVSVSLLALMGLSAVAAGAPFGFVPGGLSGTWPNIGISVSTANGWVVAEGRTEDMNQAIVWRTPLAPMNGPVVVEQAYGSAFVQVGGRQFVIDAATGRTAELRAGQVVRQPWLWGPSATASAPDAPPEAQPAQAAATRPPVDRKEASVERLANASLALSLALSHLDDVYAMVQARKATAADLKAAQQVVDDARKAVQRAQANAVTVVAPEYAAQEPAAPAATKPTAPPLSPEMRKAQARVLDLMAQKIKADGELEQARTRSPVDEQAVEAARKTAESVTTQLAEADRQLQALRLVDVVSPDAELRMPLPTPVVVDHSQPSYVSITTPAGTSYTINSDGRLWGPGTPQAAVLKAMARDFALTERQPLREALTAGRSEAMAESARVGGSPAYLDLMLRKSDQKVRQEHAYLPEFRPYPNAAADAYEDLRGLPGFRQTGAKSFEITILVAETRTPQTKPLLSK